MSLLSWLGLSPKPQTLYVKDVGCMEVHFQLFEGEMISKTFEGYGWWFDWNGGYPIWVDVEDVIDTFLKRCVKLGGYDVTSDTMIALANVKFITLGPREKFEAAVLSED